jgi:branched-chain amino acid transport system substrate-binding protein
MIFRKRSLRSAISTTILVVIIVVIIVIAGSAGYLILTSGSHTTNPYASLSYIGIGMSMPLSGSFASDGTMSLNGLELWAHNVNASGGISVGGKKLPVKLIYEDDASSATNVATIYNQLVTRTDVQFLIAPYSSPLTLAAAPIAEQHHILLLSHGGASNSIWGKGYNYTVGVLSPASAYMLPVIDALSSVSGHSTKIAMFFGNDAFSLSVMASVGPYAQSKGFSIVYNQTYDESATDYTSQLSAIQSSGAQILIGGAHFTDGETIMKGIQSLGIESSFQAIALLVAPDDPHFLSDLGTLANGIIVPSQWEANLNFSSFTPYFGNITSQQFNSTFTSTFGIVPNYEAAEAYATGLVLQKAIIDSGSLNSTTVRHQLNSEKFYTFYGLFQIGSTGIQTGHTMVVAQWQNGIKETVWPTSVATATIKYPLT